MKNKLLLSIIGAFSLAFMSTYVLGQQQLVQRLFSTFSTKKVKKEQITKPKPLKKPTELRCSASEIHREELKNNPPKDLPNPGLTKFLKTPGNWNINAGYKADGTCTQNCNTAPYVNGPISSTCNNGKYQVPVVFTIFADDDGSNPAVSSTQVNEQLGYLNTYYACKNIPLELYKAQPIRLIESTDLNAFDTFSGDGDNAFVDANHDLPNIINIYVANNLKNNGCNGFAGLPLNGTPGNDKIVMAAQCFSTVTDICNNIESTTVLIHEIGHYLGLYHTYREDGAELVNGDNACDNGDFIHDTPADPGVSAAINSQCTSRPPSPNQCNIDFSNCPKDANNATYVPDLDNIMGSNNLSGCRQNFTDCQKAKMIDALVCGRSYLCDKNVERDFNSKVINHAESPYKEICVGESAPTFQAKTGCYNWYTVETGGTASASGTNTFTPTIGTGAGELDNNTPGTYYFYINDVNAFNNDCRRRVEVKVLSNSGDAREKTTNLTTKEICGNENITLEANGFSLGTDEVIGWWVTANQPITSIATTQSAYATQLSAATIGGTVGTNANNIFEATTANNEVTLNLDCANLDDSKTYYAVPFVSAKKAAVADANCNISGTQGNITFNNQSGKFVDISPTSISCRPSSPPSSPTFTITVQVSGYTGAANNLEIALKETSSVFAVFEKVAGNGTYTYTQSRFSTNYDPGATGSDLSIIIAEDDAEGAANATLSASINITYAGTPAINFPTINYPAQLPGCTFGNAFSVSCCSVNTCTITAEAGNDKTIDCNNPTVTLEGSSNDGSAMYAWSGTGFVSGQNTASPIVNQAGTYSVTTTAANGCTATDNVTVTTNTTPPTATATTSGTLTCVNTSVTLTGTSDDTGASYVWSGASFVSGQNTASPIVNQAGTYSVTVTGINGCTATNSTTVSEDITAPTAEAGGNKTIDCTTTSVTLDGSSNDSDATYSWSGASFVSGQNTATPIVNQAGTYSLTVTSANGCTATDMTAVTSNVTTVTAEAGTDKTLTCTTTSVTLDGSSNDTGASYAWSGASFVSGQNTASPTVDQSGTYLVTVTAANGCTATDNVTVIADNTPPTVNPTVNGTLTCTTQSVTLMSNSNDNNATYVWSGGNFVSSQLAPNPVVNQAGTYSVTATSANGCTATGSVVVNENITPPTVNTTASGSINCINSTVTLTGTSNDTGATFIWSGPSFVSGQNSSSPTVNQAGTYSLTITGTNGCTNTSTIPVDEDTTVPTASAGTNKTLDCTTTSVTLEGSSNDTGATYSWSGANFVSGQNTASPIVDQVGTYSVTVTSANGCSATDEVIVNQDPNTPTANAGTDKVLTCTITSVTLDGSSNDSNATYSWSGPSFVSGQNSSSPTVDQAGTYTLSVTNANGCVATDEVIVSGDTSIPTANAGTDKVLTCTITSVTLDGSSNDSNATYSWSGPSFVSGQNSSNPTVDQVGTYTLSVTNANGCIATDEVVVTSDTSIPTADAGVDEVLTCTVTSVTLDGSSNDSNATYSWSGPSFVSGQNSSSPTVDQVGTYTLSVTNANGCVATDEVIVSGDTSIPTANAGTDKVLTCTITSVTLDGSSNDSNATYSWSGPSFVSGQNSSNPTVDQVGTYTLSVTNANGCVATDEVIVSGDTSIPTANAGVDKVLTCTVTSVTLDGSSNDSNATYSWSGPSFVSGQNSSNPTVDQVGTYTLSVTNTNGCVATDEVIVSGDTSIPTADAGTDKTITCTETSVILDGSSNDSNATYSWSGPSFVSGQNSSSPTVDQVGTYTLSVTNINGCVATDEVIVSGDTSIPTVNAGVDKVLTCTITSVTLDGSSNDSNATYSWSGANFVSGQNSSNPTVDQVGIYTLSVTNANGCVATDEVIVSGDTSIPTASAGVDKVLTCTVTSVTLDGSSNDSNATYSWSGPSFVSGQNSSNPIVDQVGTYTLSVTNANGCVATDEVVVTSDTSISTADAGSDKVLTCTVTSVILDGSSNDSNATYSWSGPSFVSGQNSSNPIVDQVGTYTLSVTNTNGCVATDEVVVTSDTSIPTADAGSDKVLTCTVTSVILDGSSNDSNATYSWSGPSFVFGQNTATPTVNQAGTYNLTVTNNVGCQATASVTVTEDTIDPIADAGSNQIIGCTNATVTLDGTNSSSGVTFEWSGAGIISGTNTANPVVNQEGTYGLIVTAPNGCRATDQVTVLQDNDVPSVEAGDDKVLDCNNLTVILDGSSTTSNVTFAWDGPSLLSGANTATPTVNGVGTYTVTVTTTSGCTNTDQVVVTQNAEVPTVDAGQDVVVGCTNNFPIQLTATTTNTNVTYQWSGPSITSSSTNASISVNAMGTYIVTITTANGCTNTDEVIVSRDNSLPIANAGNDTGLICNATTVVLDGTASSTGSEFEYVWTGPGNIVDGNTLTPTVNAIGTYTLQVTNSLTDCSSTDEVIVRSIPCCTLDAGEVSLVSGSLCSGDDVVVNLSSSTPQGATQTLLLVDPVTNQILAIENSTTFVGLADADYIIYNYEVLDLNPPSTGPIVGNTIADISDDGCYSLSAPKTFSMPQAFQALSGEVNASNGDDNVFGNIGSNKTNIAIIELEGANPPYDFLWEKDGFVSHTVSGNIVTVIYTDNATWSVTITGTNDCGVTSSMSFGNEAENDSRLDLVNIERTSDICSTRNDKEGSVTLTIEGGTAPYTYILSNAIGGTQTITTNEQIVTFENLSRGWYYVNITDSGNPKQVTENSIWMSCVQRQAQLAVEQGRLKTITGENLSESLMTLYPNPFTETSTLEFSLAESDKVSIEIFDISGKSVKQVVDNVFMDAQTTHTITIDRENLQSGLYLVRLYTEKGIITNQKLIITD